MGLVTTGDEWKFIKLKGKVAYIDVKSRKIIGTFFEQLGCFWDQFFIA